MSVTGISSELVAHTIVLASGQKESETYPGNGTRGSPTHQEMTVRASMVWRAISALSVMYSVAFAVLLMSISAGVEQEVNASLGVRELQGVSFINVGRINDILHALTILISVSMIIQTALTTAVIGYVLMNSRRNEIGSRRQSGVERSRLVKEFAIEMVQPVLIGAVIGEAVGIVVSRYIRDVTVLPVHFTAQSLLLAFPTTVIIAMGAVMVPAYIDAGRSPKHLQAGA